MKKDRKSAGEYALKVHEGTQRFAHDLLAENEKLRALAASLQSEKLLAEEQMLAGREELDRHKREQLRLERELAEIESENRRFSRQYVEVEQQNSNLVNLYVASYRLHGTLDRQEVLEIVQEIIANLVGSEQMAVFELAPESSALSLVMSSGIEPGPYRSVPVGSGLIGRVAQTGEVYLATEDRGETGRPEEADLTACVPLNLDGRVTGVLAVFRLLPQKTGIEDLDRELFDLLATHAAMALYCTALHARLGAGAPA
jgi:hypothetical protein